MCCPPPPSYLGILFIYGSMNTNFPCLFLLTCRPMHLNMFSICRRVRESEWVMLPRETSRCLLQLARDLPRQAISFCHAVIIRGKVVFALHALLIICEPIFRVDSSPPLKNRLCWHAHICMMTFSPFHAYEMGSIYINKGCHAAAVWL